MEAEQLPGTRGQSADSYWERAALSRAEEFKAISPLDLASLRIARQRVSEEIAALQRIAASFNRILSDLATVHALPAEIIIRCFELLSDDYPPGQDSSPPGLLGWITVTHVCRRWRDIALSHPTLWHKPSQKLGTQGFSEMLTRARSSPLTIDYHHSWWDSRMEHIVYDALMSHHATLQAVTIHTQSVDFMQKLSVFLTCTAPGLRSLEISCSEDFDIPPNLFDGYFSHLRHVYLKGVSNTWLRAPFQNLVTLDIMHHHSSPLESLELLLNMLDNNRSLECLSLRDVLPTHTAAAPRNSPLIRLPRMHNITLDNSEDVSCSRLLDALEVAPDATLQLNNVLLTNDACHRLILSLSRYISRQPDPPRHVNVATGPRWLTFFLRHHAAEHPDNCMLFLDLSPPDGFSFDNYLVNYPMTPAISRDLLEHLVPADARVVSIQGRTKIFGHEICLLEKVEELFLRYPDAIELLGSPVTSGMQGADRVIWPLLHTITIDVWDPVHQLNQDKSEVLAMLLLILKTRSDKGCPVQELRLRGCFYEDKDLIELRELVPKVTRLVV